MIFAVNMNANATKRGKERNAKPSNVEALMVTVEEMAAITTTTANVVCQHSP